MLLIARRQFARLYDAVEGAENPAARQRKQARAKIVTDFT
jgi:hypothetical protein